MSAVRLARVALGAAVALALLAPALVAGKTAAATPSAEVSPTARVVAEERIGRRLLELTIDSPAMGGEAHARVLLPRGFRTQVRRTWPVLYLLHGCCDTDPIGYRAWTAMTDVERLTRDADLIVVMPEGGFDGFYSDWSNLGSGGPPGYETFHLRELRSILEEHFRAGRRRAVAGLSMGGFGALSYAARHPRMSGSRRRSAAWSTRSTTAPPDRPS